MKIKIEGNIGKATAAGFFKYLENADKLPAIEDILNGKCLEMAESYAAPLDVYYLILQNLVYATGTEHRKNSELWQAFINNSIDFICKIPKFPLEIKKSFVDQLCELDRSIRRYLYSESTNQNLWKLMQQLDYIK